MKKILNLTCFVFAALSLTSCDDTWDSHYANTESNDDWGVMPPASEILYNVFAADADNYSYILSLFDIALDENGDVVEDTSEEGSVYTMESSVINSYIEKYGQYTMVIFTDEQFDNAVKSISEDVYTAIEETATLKTKLIEATVLRNLLTSKASIAAGESYKSVDGEQVSFSSLSSATAVLNGNVYSYSGDLELLAMDCFTYHIDNELWTNTVWGGGSSGTTVVIPEALGGNGSGIWYNGTDAHLYLQIGGTVNGINYPFFSGFTYKVRVATARYKSTKMAFWTYTESKGDIELTMEDSPYFDEDGDYVCDTYNGGPFLMEFEVPLYTYLISNTGIKFHIDFRYRDDPEVDGVAPDTTQTGVIIDYLEFEPLFN